MREPLDSVKDLEKTLDAPLPVRISECGIMPVSIATLEFYDVKPREFPSCGKAIQISMPDLQGPIDSAEMLWGSDIYYAFYDNPELLGRLTRISHTRSAVDV